MLKWKVRKGCRTTEGSRRTARWIYLACPGRDGGRLTVRMAFFIPNKSVVKSFGCRKIYSYQKSIRQKINPSRGASSDLFWFVFLFVQSRRQERTRLKAIRLRKDSWKSEEGVVKRVKINETIKENSYVCYRIWTSNDGKEMQENILNFSLFWKWVNVIFPVGHHWF